MTGPDEMSQLVAEIRGALSQTEAGRRTGQLLGKPLTQARVSRAESGQNPFTPDEADAFARGCAATPAQRRRLVELARRRKARPSRATTTRNPVVAQRRTRALEESSSLVRAWQDSIIIGVLQTREWTVAAGFAGGNAWWRERSARVALLDDPARRWHLVMSEAALRWNLGTEVMAGQRQHLATIARRDNVQLGIVPAGPFRSEAPPRPFSLYDQRAAIVATDVGTHFVDDPDDLRAFISQFERVEAFAVYGDEALALIRGPKVENKRGVISLKRSPHPV